MHRTCVVLALGIALAGCSNAAPTTAPSPRVTVTASPASGDRLSLHGVCENIGSGSVGATGDQGPRQAYADFAHELQVMANVSDEKASSALEPLIHAVLAGAEAKDPSEPRWQAGENRAYAALAKTCRAAGSTALR